MYLLTTTCQRCGLTVLQRVEERGCYIRVKDPRIVHHGYSVWRTISYLIVVGSRTNMKVGLVLNDEEFLLPNVWEVPWGTC